LSRILFGDAAGEGGVFRPHRRRACHDGMRGIDFEIMLGGRAVGAVLLHGLHHAPHAGGHELVRVHERRRDFPRAAAKCATSPTLSPRVSLSHCASDLEASSEQKRCLSWRWRFKSAFSASFAACCRRCGDVHHEFVPRVVEDKTSNLRSLNTSKIRAGLGGLAVGGEQAVNILLPLSCASRNRASDVSLPLSSDDS